jgi:Ca2+-binding RTX toxin-like protein
MTKHLLFKLALFAFGILLLVGILSAVAATNTVSSSRVADLTSAFNPLVNLIPAECAGMNLRNVILCPAAGGACSGSNSNDLILGSQNNDVISGKNGNDCIVGGAGTDRIDGGPGTDVCIGHLGDIYNRCETIVNR